MLGWFSHNILFKQQSNAKKQLCKLTAIMKIRTYGNVFDAIYMTAKVSHD